MRSNNALLAVGIGAAVAALCTSACKKAAETDNQNAAEAELRSARVTAPQTQVIADDDLFATVRREQLQLRARLQQDIREIDGRLAALDVERRDGRYVVDPKSRSAARAKALVERRSRLREHATTVERADERGWDELKKAVEKDLAAGD